MDVWTYVWVWEMHWKSYLPDLPSFKDVPRFLFQTLWKLEDVFHSSVFVLRQ